TPDFGRIPTTTAVTPATFFATLRAGFAGNSRHCLRLGFICISLFSLGEEVMSRPATLRLSLLALLIAGLLVGCSRDPNVRKQKYLESGNRYRDKGKFREAAIQYQNAVQLDSHFAEAHYQLGEAYLKLKDYQRAFSELSLTADLAPDNYPAQVDLANL